MTAPLSEGLSEQIPCAFSIPFLSQSILSAQLVNVHFVCATLITPVCLFFVEQERMSRHLYLGLLVMFVLFLIL